MELISLKTAVEIIMRSLVVYLVLLIGFRLAGKREIGQFTPFDLVLILLIANAVQNAMVGSDTSLIGGVIAAITLLAINFIVSIASQRSHVLEGLTTGNPTILINKGRIVKAHMEREKVTREELDAALREHGIDKISNVQIAVLEIDGSISVVPFGSEVLRTRKRVRFLRRKQ